jgi:hypothetical protein
LALPFYRRRSPRALCVTGILKRCAKLLGYIIHTRVGNHSTGFMAQHIDSHHPSRWGQQIIATTLLFYGNTIALYGIPVPFCAGAMWSRSPLPTMAAFLLRKMQPACNFFRFAEIKNQ